MMQVCLQIQRYSPERANWQGRFVLETQANTTILECLNHIKGEQDGSLAFRKNCRNTICGSCAMEINGRPALACKQTIQAELKTARFVQETGGQNSTLPIIEIQPLQNFPVIKDLVVEMGQFWQNLAQVDPYVSTAALSVAEREFLQSPEERAALNQTGNCILCGACYSACNAKTVTPEFVGPHALAKAYRVLADTRDTRSAERLAQYTQDLSGVWGCTRCLNCNSACPMEVAPLDQITRIKAQRLSQPPSADSRAVRHRRVLLDLVAQGGWVDERRFGLAVVGNHFRDLKGLWSLMPLGFQMLQRGKFPMTFEASEGRFAVRALLHSLRMRGAPLEGALSVTPKPSPNPADSATSPPKQSEAAPEPKLGWTQYAEQINGRFAMIGLLLLLLIEWVTDQDFLTWLGLR